MKHEEPIPRPDEKLGHAMVKAHIINENQLKTALDYQRSLGGSLVEVVGKLGFARPAVLDRFLAESNLGGSSGVPPADAPSGDDEGGPRAADEKCQASAMHAPAAVAEREGSEGEAEGGSTPAGGPSPLEPSLHAGMTSDPVLGSLIELLIQKGVFRRRELEDLLLAHRGREE